MKGLLQSWDIYNSLVGADMNIMEHSLLLHFISSLRCPILTDRGHYLEAVACEELVLCILVLSIYKMGLPCALPVALHHLWDVYKL